LNVPTCPPNPAPNVPIAEGADQPNVESIKYVSQYNGRAKSRHITIASKLNCHQRACIENRISVDYGLYLLSCIRLNYLAITSPEPARPEKMNPALRTVNIARPLALDIMLGGITLSNP
jgi:hypothetical protein